MKKIKSLLFIILALILTKCTYEIDPKLYGTYENNDTFNLHYSKITLYDNNNYSYYSSTCMTYGTDTGRFQMENDTIYFTSYNMAAYCLKILDTVPASSPNAMPLTGKKVLYEDGKLTHHYKRTKKKQIITGMIIYTKKDK